MSRKKLLIFGIIAVVAITSFTIAGNAQYFYYTAMFMD